MDMDLKKVIAAQILKTDQENQIKEEASKKAALEQAQLEEAKKTERFCRLAKIEFSSLREQLKATGLPKILMTIVDEMNYSPDDRFVTLRNRLIKIAEKDKAYISLYVASRLFYYDGEYKYNKYSLSKIELHWYGKICSGGKIVVCEICCLTPTLFNFSMNLYQHRKDIDFTATTPEELARKIIECLMAE